MRPSGWRRRSAMPDAPRRVPVRRPELPLRQRSPRPRLPSPAGRRSRRRCRTTPARRARLAAISARASFGAFQSAENAVSVPLAPPLAARSAARSSASAPRRSAASSAPASARSSTAGSSPRWRRRSGSRARGSTPADHLLTEGAVIPRALRPHADGRQHHLGDRLPRGDRDHPPGGGGKGGGGGGVKITEYLYFASFAVALCEGPITGIGRIWADGKPMDLAGVTCALHPGDEDQTPDPFIAAKMGAANTPGLSRHGLCRLRGAAARALRQPAAAALLRGVPADRRPRHRRGAGPRRHLIPASGEFAYATEAIAQDRRRRDRRRRTSTPTADAADIVVALDRLQACAPNGRERSSLVVAWFGDDLRAGSLQRPAGRRGQRQVDHARELVGQRRRPRRRHPRQPRRSGPPGLWRHAVRLRRGAGDPGDEGARAAASPSIRSS